MSEDREVLVRATRSFEEWTVGDMFICPADKIQPLIDKGFFEVVEAADPVTGEPLDLSPTETTKRSRPKREKADGASTGAESVGD